MLLSATQKKMLLNLPKVSNDEKMHAKCMIKLPWSVL
jgi:hypothetical protein